MKNYSWKTTMIAVMALLASTTTLIINPLLDNDPSTIPAWGVWVPMVIAAVSGFFTRDDEKSDEQVGAGNTGKTDDGVKWS